eukprot:CAMPEP_0204821934 /NCGR_PEP_ID=MMETSP1346-20131115/132_1 /ASSEMBLY_ACC=CAM_ASM_000771 /TAXON_ID=215587 /ORGANISM="Aplanochytrium stocchinoi, Strain GSBS06" /LENGTH=630 /DNA_ID=CAMNT_0051947903 /DNA_START=409 /DNA_END=2304 /DNA_ORIENTATION=-
MKIVPVPNNEQEGSVVIDINTRDVSDDATSGQEDTEENSPVKMLSNKKRLYIPKCFKRQKSKKKKSITSDEENGCVARVLDYAENAIWLPVVFMVVYLLSIGLSIAFLLDQTNTAVLGCLGTGVLSLAILAPLMGEKVDKKPKLKWLKRQGTSLLLTLSLEAWFDIALVVVLLTTDSQRPVPLNPDDLKIEREITIAALVCAVLSALMFKFKLVAIFYFGWDATKIEYDSSPLKWFAYNYAQPLGIALSDTADILFIARTLGLGTGIVIQPKDILILTFLIMNVVLSEFQTLIATIKELQTEKPPPEEKYNESDEDEEIERKQGIRNNRLNGQARVRMAMRFKARIQTILVGNFVFPVVFAATLRNRVSLVESVVILVPLLGFIFAATNLISENICKHRLFARTLNEASRDVMVRSLTAMWATTLFTFPELTSSLEERTTSAIFGFYIAYSLVPLLVRLRQEWKRRDIVLMQHRELGTLDRETGKLTPMLFRSANADTLKFYIDTNASYEKIESIIRESAIPARNNRDIKSLQQDVSFLAYTYYEAKLSFYIEDDKEELLRMLVMFLSCILYENQSDWTRNSFPNVIECAKESSVHTFYLGRLRLTVDDMKDVLFLDLFLAREKCTIVAL